MSQFKIRPASRKKSYLKIGIMGPSGSGKTYGALELAFGLCGNWEDITVIDAENRSADMYSQKGAYQVVELDAPFRPTRYIEAIQFTVSQGCKVLIIDGISREWEACLKWVDELKASTKNQLSPWGVVGKAHDDFINTILMAQLHIVCTLRSKNKHEIVDGPKGKEVRKLGMEPIQREGVEYEFGFLFDVSMDHVASVAKQRGEVFAEGETYRLSSGVGEALRKWNEEGGDAVGAKKSYPTPAILESIFVETTQLKALIKSEMGNEIDAKTMWPEFYAYLQDGIKRGKQTDDWSMAIEYAESIRSEYHAISEGHLPGVEDEALGDNFFEERMAIAEELMQGLAGEKSEVA